MEILKDKINNIIIYNLSGRFDSNSFREFEIKIFKEIEDGSYYFVLNLEKLDYLSSAGLRTMLKVTKKLNSLTGKLVICSIPNHILEIFEISGFNHFVKIVPTLKEATKQFD